MSSTAIRARATRTSLTRDRSRLQPALCAWHYERDVHHSHARELVTLSLEGRWGRGLLLDYVFLEVVTALLARRGRKSAIEASRRLLEARELDPVFGAQTVARTLETSRSQPGRKLSFTDAAIVGCSTA